MKSAKEIRYSKCGIDLVWGRRNLHREMDDQKTEHKESVTKRVLMNPIRQVVQCKGVIWGKNVQRAVVVKTKKGRA